MPRTEFLESSYLLRPCPVDRQLACAVGSGEVAVEAVLGLQELLEHDLLGCVEGFLEPLRIKNSRVDGLRNDLGSHCLQLGILYEMLQDEMLLDGGEVE